MEEVKKRGRPKKMLTPKEIEERKERRREYQRKYNKTEKRKEYQREYAKTEKRKEYQKEYRSEPSRAKIIKYSRKQKSLTLYQITIKMPATSKKTILVLCDKLNVTINQLFIEAVEEKHNITLKK